MPVFRGGETGKSVRVALSTGQEQALGLQSYQEVLAQSEIITCYNSARLSARSCPRGGGKGCRLLTLLPSFG